MMRKTRLLTLLFLLMTAATGAWADPYLYLDGNGATVTLKYGEDVSSYPFYDDENWIKEGYTWYEMNSIEYITVDPSCQNYMGTTLSNLFNDFENLQAINDIGNLNTSSVTDMSFMFMSCFNLISLNLSDWNTSQVENMTSMFKNCLSLTTLNLSGWDTSQVENMESMFENCSNLTLIYVDTNWNTQNVEEGTAMFDGCTNLPNYDQSSQNDVTKAHVGDGGYLTSNIKTIYCKMEYGWWTVDNAAIGIYAWDENGQEKVGWPGERMKLADYETNIWKFNLDVATYKNCIFTRVNGGDGAVENWGAKTQDLTIPTDDNNLFTISNSTATWGDNVCNGEWSEFNETKYLLASSWNNWVDTKVNADRYTVHLNPGKYQFKVIDGENWKGIDDMTEVAGGLYRDQDGNVCFVLDNWGDVIINYKSGKLFTVEGNFAAPKIKLIGIVGWDEITEAVSLTPAADLKSTSVTIPLVQSDNFFKVIREDEWLSKENDSGSYRIHFGWNWVDELVKDNNLDPILLYTTQVGKEHTFTYDYATGKLTVTFPTTLDEEDDNTDILTKWNGKRANVTLNRTLYKDGDWNTLCLPFSIDNISDTPLEGATLKTLESASLDNTTGTLTLNFSDNLTAIEAGTPYIIKWTKANDYVDDDAHNLVNPVFNGVTIDNTARNKTCDLGDDKSISFVGNFSPVALQANDNTKLYLGSNNNLYYPSVNLPINAFRAYFQMTGITAGTVTNARIYFDNDTEATTGVKEVIGVKEVKDNSWYTLEGLKLSGKPTTKGVYINNGRKVVVK